MAAIGFQLRRLLRLNSITGELAAYTYAGLAGSGPLLVSILGIFLIGLVGLQHIDTPELVMQFQVSITYLMAASLIITGPVQLVLSRSIAMAGGGHSARLLASYYFAAGVTTVLAVMLGLILASTVFLEQTLWYRMLMLMAFVVLSNIWLAAISLANARHYMAICEAFFLGYLTTVVVALVLLKHGLIGLLGAFLLGHLVLYARLVWKILTIDRNAAPIAIRELLPGRRTCLILAGVGLLFNLGIWVDKFIFWFSSSGKSVLGPLHASIIYDFPIFISYLCIIPGMAAFLLRMETDFIDHYQGYYRAIGSAGTLDQIVAKRDLMVGSVRDAFHDLLKVQMVVVLLIFAFGGSLLESMGISTLYLPLLRVDVVGTSLQLLFLACINMLFYLNRITKVLILTALFTTLNATFTWVSLQIGPPAYGYGFAGSLLIVVLVAVVLLDREFHTLEYRTFMLQGS